MYPHACAGEPEQEGGTVGGGRHPGKATPRVNAYIQDNYKREMAFFIREPDANGFSRMDCEAAMPC